MTINNWKEEFEKNIAPEIMKAVAGYGKFIESGNIHLAEDMYDVAHTGYSLVTNNHTYNLQIHLQNFIQSLLDKQKEEIVQDLVIKFQMEGDFGKLTPFQQTVNTYIKNRGEEIIKQIKEM